MMMDVFAFDLDGGRACLDFANTLSGSSGEHLAVYGDLVAFAEQSELITHAEAERLQSLARAGPAGAEDVLARAHALRGAVYAIFSAVAAGGQPHEEDLRRLNT